MEYGGQLGVVASSSVVIFGLRIGYAWIILAAFTAIVIVVASVRRYFRRDKILGLK